MIISAQPAITNQIWCVLNTFYSIFFLNIACNDYLNPYTLTFKNPKTVQMFNIIILYHYVMTYLYGIIIFTFLFIFFSFFRSYFFFHYHYPYEVGDKNFRTIWGEAKNQSQFDPLPIWTDFVNRFRFLILQRKSSYMAFYKEDIEKSRTDQVTHAPLLEFLWVVIPAGILVAIAYPSLVMLYYNESYVDPVYNITVIGNQWYWTYEYNDFNLIEIFKRFMRTYSNKTMNYFDATVRNVHEVLVTVSRKKVSEDVLFYFIRKDREIASRIPRRISVDCNLIIAKDPKFLRLLTTDQCLVIPSKTPVRFLITSNDVIHSWAVPGYGIKMDAVPGRLNQQILNVPLMGTSWGQCSELCGVNHAYMPIEIKVLAWADFLFFMEIRIRDVLLPFIKEAWDYRIKYLLHYTEHFRDTYAAKRRWPSYIQSEEDFYKLFKLAFAMLDAKITPLFWDFKIKLIKRQIARAQAMLARGC